MLHKIVKKQNNSDKCIVCGDKNPYGFHARFYELDNGELAAVFHTKELQQSFPGRVHGGMVAAILDETIGRAICIDKPGSWGVTTEIQVKYKKPVPLNETLRAVGRITRDTRKIFEGTGELLLENGEVAAEAWAKYLKVAIEDAAGDDFTEREWHYLEEDDPREIEI
ncbi:PaaI family thioesterase [Sinanaerobacter chloroacetimidivorans]|jgi:uncharacterized protein (TIGR00369 family)|uniref:Acyl-coenzyme A thioesterase THEM4 n=1 Tax=Sinanaerobacter chloroacetimidivorans TaxID=2818044 RepID=A0A8J7VY69_9FIRM|nr:PaaI family thioesterase [Sinanaerobacter chloroacetimidivorans]MBR0597272.1 PaaI family thioesterase [Sinanaerobacter chloroacetimidivorans]